MRRKAQQSNRSFLFGTLVLGILVLGIVVAFTALSYKLSTDQSKVYRDVYHLQLDKGLQGKLLDIYLNDSLLHSGYAPDTALIVERTTDDNALIIVDQSTDIMRIVEIPGKRGRYIFALKDDELEVREL